MYNYLKITEQNKKMNKKSIRIKFTFDIENEDLQKNNKSEFIKVNETGEIAYNYLILFSENTELFPHLEVGKTLEIDEKQYKIIQKVYDQPDHKEVILLAI